MSELAAKLRKQRSIIEEGGHHFESSPQGAQTPPLGSPSREAPTSQSSPRARAPRLSTGRREDLSEALYRRRLSVDRDAQTFESTPAAQAADAAATPGAAVPRAEAPAVAATPGRRSGASFHLTMERQRTSVDGSALHFESSPAAAKADVAREAPEPRAIATQPPPAAAEPAAASEEPRPSRPASPAEEVSATREDAPAATEPASAAEASAHDSAREQASGKEVAAEEVEAAPTPSRASTRPPSEEGAPAETEQRSLEEPQAAERDGATQAAKEADEEANEERRAKREAPEGVDSKGTITVYKDRVAWLVGLRADPLPGVFASEPFEIGGCGPVTLRLRADRAAGACVLSLHGDAERPAGLRVGLFAAKGWAKLSVGPWPEGACLEERFQVGLEGRASLLCGVVHRTGRGR